MWQLREGLCKINGDTERCCNFPPTIEANTCLANTWGRTEEPAWSPVTTRQGKSRPCKGRQPSKTPAADPLRPLLLSPSFVPVRFGWNPSPLHATLTTIWVWDEEKERRKGGWAAQTRVMMRVILGSDVISSYYEASGITESWQQLGFCFPKVANKKLYSCSSLCENCPWYKMYPYLKIWRCASVCDSRS